MLAMVENPVIVAIGMLFLSVAIPFVIMGFLQKYSKNTWFCSFWGWHLKPGVTNFNGCNLKGKCPRCETDVMQDGQGNWF